MAKLRSYKLMCPIARGLDRIGDRWTLLILRDLHAGPARFSDLQKGLTGIAANLLTERLAKLVDDGLIARHTGDHGAALYALTETGRQTRNILFELALLGSQFPLETEAVEPGNVRTIAVTLGTACHRAITTSTFGMYLKLEASMIVDGEIYALTVRDRNADMVQKELDAPDLILETSYASMLALGEGEISLQDFVDSHARMEVLTSGKERDFQELMTAALAQLQG